MSNRIYPVPDYGIDRIRPYTGQSHLRINRLKQLISGEQPRICVVRGEGIGDILAGMDVIAVDFIVVNLVGLDVQKVFNIKLGRRWGMGRVSFFEIEIVGDSIEAFKVELF